jgi:predicted membrane-bound mannosyltransferase
MRWPIALSFAVLLAGSGIGTSTAQTAPKINAQKLVDEAMAKHPEVVVLSMHVTPPHKTENVIIASSVRPQSPPRSSPLHHKTQPAWIGRRSDADDERAMSSGKSNLEVNKAGNHIEITVPLQDHSGNTIGAVGAVFNYKEGDDKGKDKKVAEQIRDEWRAQISNKDSLFEPAK